MMNIYEIKQKIIDSERLVISKKEFSNIINKPIEIARVYANRMKNKKLLKIIRGKLVFTDNEFIIANQLIEPSYISLHSALYLNNKIQQIPQKIQCINPKNTIKQDNFIYYKIHKKLFFGYKKHKIDNSWVFIAETEKALIDGIYLNRMSEELVKEQINNINRNKLKKMLKQIESSKVKKTKRTINFFKEVLK